MAGPGASCCGCEHAEATFRPARLGLREESMKSSSAHTGFVSGHRLSGHRLSGRWWLRPLRAVAVALLLLAFPLGAAKAAVPSSDASGVHVYLLRGVLNIFSLGLDDIAAKLQAQGIRVTITNYLGWSALADEAAAEYRSGRVRTIILVGHSSGATVLPDMVARLDQLGAPVKLAIGLDSVFRTSLQGRVGRYINFYVANGNGEPVARTSRLHGTLENVNVQNVPGVGHLTIDKNEIMQGKVIGAIDAVAFGPSSRSR
jgi:hypothetical protein